MSIKTRLKALVAKMPPPPFSYAPAERFAIVTVAMVGNMIGDDEAIEQELMRYARQRIYELKFSIENCKWPTADAVADFEALCAATVVFFRLLPKELRSRVILGPALVGSGTTGHKWADRWILSIARQESRLPPDITPETMGTLATIYLDRSQDVDKCHHEDCPACGLRLPRHITPPLSTWKLLPGRQPFDGQPPPWFDLPAFFTACPHCGAKHRYPHDRKANRQDWQSKAAEEIKVFLGVVKQATKGCSTRSKRHAR